MDDLLGSLLVAIFGERFAHRLSRRRAQRGVYDCALRREGTKGWEHGSVTITPGQLTFKRRGGGEHGLSVTMVSRRGRPPSGRETWGVSPKATIYTLETSAGALEWALVAPNADEVASLARPV